MKEDAAWAWSEFLNTREWVTQLESSLILECGLVETRKQKIVELEVELQAKEAAIKEAEEKLQSVEDEVSMDKVPVVAKAKTKAIEKFKKLDEFKVKVIKCFSVSYGFSLDA
ncbi:hypothetical protein COCNU_01G017000 [Cocos nucifera]|uniref:Uncharacterized protein n=1 Tax=Cocos nucifera TaxID=13894 RepID=A0A8K0HWG6_COCNU|nr:hypothetical protein COCNU_01G017000 [Cocos nucifera]